MVFQCWSRLGLPGDAYSGSKVHVSMGNRTDSKILTVVPQDSELSKHVSNEMVATYDLDSDSVSLFNVNLKL